MRTVLSSGSDQPDLLGDLLAPISRVRVVAEIAMVLGVPETVAGEVVEAFDALVAGPLEKNLKKLNGRTLARRNPMIYTARGTRTVSEWIDRVLADRETSSFETHLGKFQEEVARIVSGGFKPGSGVDLQVEDDDNVVRLYAIQASPETKNAGGRKSDVMALKLAARPLRTQLRLVEMYVAILFGKEKTYELESEPGIQVLASDEFWFRVSGIPGFSVRFLQASLVLAELVRERSADDIVRIKREAMELYDDGTGNLALEALAKPPKLAKVKPPEQLPLRLFE
jgi:Type II restriction endonuclease EcoO109I